MYISYKKCTFARVSYISEWAATSPSKLPLPWGDLDAHLRHGSLVLPKQHLDRLSLFCWTRYCDRPTDHTCLLQ